MEFQKYSDFLDAVLSYVKFPLDREEIRLELSDHIVDKIQYYVEQGLSYKEAEAKAIMDMGDPKDIGSQLNKEHNPIIGWLWVISKGLVSIFILINIFIVGPRLLYLTFSIFDPSPIKDIPKEDIVYKLDINERVQIDDRVINFTDIVYDKNETIHIIYNYYDKKIWRMGWSHGYLGTIKDDKGNEYFSGSGYRGGGIVAKGRKSIRDFPRDAKSLIIEHDFYNRYYRVEIPLESGDANE